VENNPGNEDSGAFALLLRLYFRFVNVYFQCFLIIISKPIISGKNAKYVSPLLAFFPYFEKKK
jgi:hypothetical protein